MAEKKAAMDWKSPETQYKLAMSALASLEAPAFSAAKMATYMGCTPKAVTHQIPKLKQDLEDLRKSVAASAPATPGNKTDNNGEAEPGATPTATTKSTTKKRPDKGKTGETDAEADQTGSPSKKVKTPAKPRAKKAAGAATTAAAKKKKSVRDSSDDDEVDDEIAKRKDTADGKGVDDDDMDEDEI